MTDRKMNRLLKLLDDAVQLSAEFRGGYSNQFGSAEEFHTALAQSVEKYKGGDNEQINSLWLWFAPTCSWDDFAGLDGQDLANEIFGLVSQENKQLEKQKIIDITTIALADLEHPKLDEKKE